MPAVSTLGNRSSAAAVGPTEAKNALRRFRTQGFALDPEDSAHQAAYLSLRSGLTRVYANHVATYLAKAKDELAHGATSTLAMWAAPAKNFPDGLPRELREFAKSPEDLAEISLRSGGEVDMTNFYVIDE